MKRIFLYSFIITIMLGVGSNAYAQAQDKYTLLEPLPCIQGTGNSCTQNQPLTQIDLNGYIQYVFKFALALAVFLAIVMIIWGGFEYMLSEVPFVKVNAKARINNAIFGLIAVFVSYLILYTIDPRLVQVNTSIPKINITIDPSTINFSKQLADQLTNLSQENQLQINQLNSKISDLEKRKADLTDQYARDEISDEEYDVGWAELNDQLRATKSNQYQIITNSNGLIGFNKAYSILNNPDPSPDDKQNLSQYTATPVANTLVNGKYPTNSPNTLQNQYNIEINKILQDTGDGVAAQTMAKQRDFYISQIQEEQQLTDKIKENGKYYSTGGQGVGTTVNNKPYLEAKLNNYKTLLADPRGPTEAGIPADQYKNIMQTRIDIINQALNPPKK